MQMLHYVVGGRERIARGSGKGGETPASDVQGGAQGRAPQMFWRGGRLDGVQFLAARDGGLVNTPLAPVPVTQAHLHSGALTLLSLPGCELSGHTRSFTFKVEEEDDAEHMLALTMVRGVEGGWW